MIKLVITYLKSLLKHWVRLIGGTVIGIIAPFLIDYIFAEDSKFQSIIIFLIALFIAQFLSRKDYYNHIEKGCNLPNKHKKFLQEVYDDNYHKSYDYNNDGNGFMMIQELKEEGYITITAVYKKSGYASLTTKGRKYIEQTLPL